MHVSYSSDELKNLARILNEILVQARKRDPEMSTDDIVQRVCALADGGERDIRKLESAAFDPAAL
ncbi:MAG: hypothetical protein JSR99_07950 [Proteobacteria bacterium]|nr:hypothetical protein [Pseudomonadota bacterium]